MEELKRAIAAIEAKIKTVGTDHTKGYKLTQAVKYCNQALQHLEKVEAVTA